MSERIHYICNLIIGGKSHFILWYSDECDGLLVNEAFKLRWFASREESINFIVNDDLAFENHEVVEFNFDILHKWTVKPAANEIDCKLFLDAWNMIKDVKSSVACTQRSSEKDEPYREIYDKLFYGCNLPAVTPEGEHYKPQWSENEIGALVDLFTIGIDLIKDCFE